MEYKFEPGLGVRGLLLASDFSQRQLVKGVMDGMHMYFSRVSDDKFVIAQLGMDGMREDADYGRVTSAVFRIDPRQVSKGYMLEHTRSSVWRPYRNDLDMEVVDHVGDLERVLAQIKRGER